MAIRLRAAHSVFAVMVTAALFQAATTTATAQSAAGSVHAVAAGSTAVPDSYLVMLKPSSSDAATTAQALAARHGGQVRAVWRHALRGFALRASASAAARIAGDPRVSYVEQDAVIAVSATQSPTPSWGLDRVDQRNLPLNSAYTYDTTASNVHVYIVDTGIRTTHADFGGRAVWGTNTTGDGNDTDCNGHGTHVAGTVGGASYGVAKGVQLVAVKVLNCAGSGTTAGVVDGVNWVAQNAIKPAVANMSLGGGAQQALDDAVAGAINSGITFAIASGNSNADACNFSPARVATALTVNNSDINDNRASTSNYGTCTDLFAPGTNITSAWNTSDTATNTITGTSMATPHVSGSAALYLSANPSANPVEVSNAINGSATPNVINNPGAGSPNRLLFTGTSTSPPGKTWLNRYLNSRGDHATGISAPFGYVKEGDGFGWVNTAASAGTHPIYQCLVAGRDYMTSTAANCEGTTFIGVIGYMYDSPPTGANQPVRRCRVTATGDHFDSVTSYCEGQIAEGILGYTT
jgi:subtilisin family serine protease